MKILRFTMMLLAALPGLAAAEVCKPPGFVVDIFELPEQLKKQPDKWIGCFTMGELPFNLTSHRALSEFERFSKPVRYEVTSKFVANVTGTYSFTVMADMPPVFTYGHSPRTQLYRRPSHSGANNLAPTEVSVEQPIHNLVESAHMSCEMTLSINGETVAGMKLASQFRVKHLPASANRIDEHLRCGFNDHSSGHTKLKRGTHELRFAVQCDSLTSFSRDAFEPSMTLAAAANCPADYNYWNVLHRYPGNGALWDILVHRPGQQGQVRLTAEEPAS